MQKQIVDEEKCAEVSGVLLLDLILRYNLLNGHLQVVPGKLTICSKRRSSLKVSKCARMQ